MIYKQHQTPAHANVGDAWVCPHNSFKRVLSRGGAWENVNLGEKHRDEVEHEQESSAQPEAVAGDDSAEVPSGTGESAPGNGDDGETVSEPSGERGSEDTSVDPPEGEGVDGNGSPVV